MIDHDLSPEQRDELGNVQPLLQHLEQYNVPEPDTAKLLASLTPMLKQRLEAETLTIQTLPQRGLRDLLRLAWAQMALLEAPFWWSSLLLTLIGFLLGISYGGGAVALCLMLLSPLIAVIGVAYLFRPATRTLWELEQLSQVQPLEFLYARLALILMLNAIMAVFLLFFVWTQGIQIILWRLLLIWIGPMLGLTGIALFCAVRWNAIASLVMPMAAWGGLVLVGWRETILVMSPDLPNAAEIIARLNLSNTIPLLALVLLAVGVVLVYESGRSIARWR